MGGYDVFSVRGLYTSLGDGWTYLNAHSCPQIPERVSAAVARSFRLSTAVTPVSAPSGRHGNHAQQLAGAPEGDSFFHQARVAVADLAGASAEAVVLGPSLDVLYRNLALAMQPMWRNGSTIVLSALDRPALTSPFTEAGPQVRWAQPDLGTGELPGWQYRELVDGSTRLVSLSAAHDVLGTVADIPQITDDVRERSRAWVLVDASDYAAYRLLDIQTSGADIIGIDVAKLGGPQIAALVFRDPLMFKRLRPVNPDPAAAPGTAAVLASPVSPGLAGAVGATVDHYAALTDVAGSRRTQLKDSMAALGSYVDHLRDDLYLFMGSLPAVHILGVTGEAAAEADHRRRLPRLSFAVRDVPAETVQQRLVHNGLVTSLTPRSPLLTEMGVDDIGGAVTVGLGPFNTSHDINQLVRTVASLA